MLNDYNHCDHLFLVFIHQKVRSFGRHTYLFHTVIVLFKFNRLK